MRQLNDKQLATLIKLLAARERSLLSVVQDHVAELRDSSTPDAIAPAGDSADQAEIELVRQYENATVQRYVRSLRAIESAHERLAGSEAGACTDCGEAIGYARLLAQPTASRCVYCQAIHERTHLPDLDLVA